MTAFKHISPASQTDVPVLSVWLGGVIGAAMPSLLIGRSLLSVTLGMSLVAALCICNRALLLEDMKRAVRHDTIRGFALVLLVWSAAIPGSWDPVLSLQSIAGLAALAAAGIALHGLMRSGVIDVRMMMRVLLIGGGAVAVVILAGRLAAPEIFGLIKFKGWQPIELPGFGRVLANAYAVATPLVVLSGLVLGGGWRRVSVILTAAALVLAVDTSTGAALLGFAALIGVVCVSVILQTGSGLLRAGMVAILFLALAGIVTLHTLSNDNAVTETPDVFMSAVSVGTHRQQIWTDTVKIASERPLLGHGPNALKFHPVARQPSPYFDNFTVIPSHPHNWVLEILSETGWAGLTALVSWLLVTHVYVLRRYLAHSDPALLAALATSGAFWGAGLANFSFWSPWWQASYVACTACCLALRRSSHSGAD